MSTNPQENNETPCFNPYDVFVGGFLPNGILARTDLSPTAKICWARIAGYNGLTDAACNSYEELAAATGLSVQAAMAGVRELRAAGLVQ
ncbi:MAG: hypothetical protein ACOZF0_12855 [Thermodesulfobacteriota bacterium]